jgi:hypothetical protein
MKAVIAMFLLAFSIASCTPKCDCSVECQEKCKVEAVPTETSVDSTEVAPAPESTEVK